MAPLSKTLALAGALFAALGSAAPVDKRETDIVYETVTSVVWTTVDVTTTIYGNAPATATPTVDSQVQAPGNSQPEQSVNYKPHSSSTSTSTSTSTTVWWTPSPETWATSASTSTSTSTTVWWTAPSSSSTTEAQWTPSTTTVPAAATTTSAAATTSAASSSSSSGYSGSCSGSTPCTGDLTYYVAGLGSCGKYSDGSTDKVVALPVGIMKDSDCGKTVHITYNGVTMEGTVWDKCMGCDDVSIDLSEKLFGYFGTEAEGRLTGAKWYIE